MSDYIVYKKIKCKSCKGTGTYDCLADYALNRTCIDCEGSGHTRITEVPLEDAIKDLLKEHSGLYVRYLKLI